VLRARRPRSRDWKHSAAAGIRPERSDREADKKLIMSSLRWFVGGILRACACI